MKHIVIRKVSMENFKGMRSFSITLNPEVNNIYGRNETGKTTILDAITWCLFNKDHLYRTSFAIKTHDGEGNDIPNLDHSVELTILIDGVEKSLKRVLKEKWAKPRGQEESVLTGNYQECYIDGQMLSSTDFSKFISSIIDEEIFKTITSPTYFLSLPWQQKRTFLQQMAGEITPTDVTRGEEKFGELIEALKKDSPEAYAKHIRYNMREVKKLLDEVPVRLSEQEKALPEKQNWNDVENTLKQKQSELESISEQIVESATMTPEDKQRKELRQQIEECKTVLEERQKVVQMKYRQSVEEAQGKYRVAQQGIQANNHAINDLKMRVNQYKNDILSANDLIKAMEKRTADFRETWKEVSSRKFNPPETLDICPTCGQYIPEEQRAEKLATLQQEFNAKKAERLTELREEAAHIKSNIADAQEVISKHEDEISIIEAGIKKIEDKNTELEKVLPYTDLQYTDLLIDDAQYTEADTRIHQLQQQLASIKNDEPSIFAPTDNLKEHKTDVQKQIQELTMVLASKVQYEKGISLINEIKAQQKDLSMQLLTLEQAEDAISEYTERLNNLLETRVNEHFSVVKWRMFRTLVNGTKEPYCECTLKGTDASNGLNSAGVIQAGLDICNAISKYYDVSAPVVIDNAESINEDNFSQPQGQQIRLFVSNDSILTLK